ncbi:reverse transcriptase domain-containing protein, partial [Tanacetum coccineum]
VKLGDLEAELIEINANSKKLQRGYNELVEYKLVLQKAGEYFRAAHNSAIVQHRESDSASEESLETHLLTDQDLKTDQGKQVKLGFLAGLAPVDEAVVDPSSGEKVYDTPLYINFISLLNFENELSSECTVFRFPPYLFNDPKRRLTIEEKLAKFINEGKREYEEMEIFIKELRTTNKLLLKEQKNLLSELKIKVNELSKVMGNVLIPKNEVKGVTTRGRKMTSEATPSKEINETGINKNEPPRFEHDVQEKPHDVGVENKSLSISEKLLNHWKNHNNHLSLSQTSTVFREPPYLVDYPMRRLTMEEILAKFVDEGRREHEEMEIFIKEFRTTNELLLKTQSNLLSELVIEVNELSKVMSNVLILKNEVKGVKTRG